MRLLPNPTPSIRNRFIFGPLIIALVCFVFNPTLVRAQTSGDTALAESNKPLLGSTQDREVVDASVYPYSAVGRINIAGFRSRSHCTGALIGERLAVTAAHCLYNLKMQRWAQPSSVHFVAGYQRGEFVAHSIAKALIISPGFDGPKWEHPDNHAEDWALVILEEPIGRDAGYLGFSPMTNQQLKPLINRPNTFAITGYPRDRAHAISVANDCGVTGGFSDKDLLIHSCTIQSGDSGAPLSIYVKGGFLVIGVNSAAEVSTNKGLVNTAVPLRSYYREILNAIRKTEPNAMIKDGVGRIGKSPEDIASGS